MRLFSQSSENGISPVAEVFAHQPARIIAACGICQQEAAAEAGLDFPRRRIRRFLHCKELCRDAAACALQYRHFFRQRLGGCFAGDALLTSPVRTSKRLRGIVHFRRPRWS